MISQEEKSFIKEYYPNNGSKFCAEKLNTTPKRIKQIAHRMGVKINNKVFINDNRFIKNKINVDEFTSNMNCYSAYLLGFLWADGYIYQNGYNIITEITTDDANDLKWVFLKTGAWKFIPINSPSKKKWKPQTKIYCTNKNLYCFLKENDYGCKTASPTKILKLIPKNLQSYFFRGLSDGDGCFYANTKIRLTQYNLSSNFEQDWQFISSLMGELDIVKYSIKKYSRINKKTNRENKFSCVRFSNKDSLLKFGNFIYNGINFGLYRKYKKFIEIASYLSN